MDVVRDVLDKPIKDRNGREMGRVDGIVLECRNHEPPRLKAILIGPPVLGHRLHPAIGRWLSALGRALGFESAWPLGIDFSAVHEIERDVRIDVAIGSTPAGTVEQRLRSWILKIPGNG